MLSLARMYINDLEEYHGGDIARFERMVGAGGAKFPNATPEKWAKFALNALRRASTNAENAPVIAEMAKRLGSWGYPNGLQMESQGGNHDSN